MHLQVTYYLYLFVSIFVICIVSNVIYYKILFLFLSIKYPFNENLLYTAIYSAGNF